MFSLTHWHRSGSLSFVLAGIRISLASNLDADLERQFSSNVGNNEGHPSPAKGSSRPEVVASVSGMCEQFCNLLRIIFLFRIKGLRPYVGALISRSAMYPRSHFGSICESPVKATRVVRPLVARRFASHSWPMRELADPLDSPRWVMSNLEDPIFDPKTHVGKVIDRAPGPRLGSSALGSASSHLENGLIGQARPPDKPVPAKVTPRGKCQAVLAQDDSAQWGDRLWALSWHAHPSYESPMWANSLQLLLLGYKRASVAAASALHDAQVSCTCV